MPADICTTSEITTGSILPIDLLRDNIPVAQYFKTENMTGKLIPSSGGDSIDLDNLRENHDFFEVGKINSSASQLIQSELIEPAKKVLDTLIHNLKEKLDDIQFLNGICFCDPLRANFLKCLGNIYDDHLTLLNLKRLNDSNKEILQQSLDVCSLATILAIRSNVTSQDVSTICKGALLINIGRTQVSSSKEDATHIDKGCHYLSTLGYDQAIINIVRFKSSFEKITPEPRLLIGIVKAAYLYHLSFDKYGPSSSIDTAKTHDATMKKLKTYVRLNYMHSRAYHLMVRVFNESKIKTGDN